MSYYALNLTIKMGNTARAFLNIDDNVSEPTVFTNMRQHDNDIIGAI